MGMILLIHEANICLFFPHFTLHTTYVNEIFSIAQNTHMFISQRAIIIIWLSLLSPTFDGITFAEKVLSLRSQTQDLCCKQSM